MKVRGSSCLETVQLKLPCPNFGRMAHFAGLSLLLAGCVPSGISEAVLPADNTYACRDGKLLRAERAGNGSFVVASLGERSVRLSRMDSAAQEKYGDGPTTLCVDGDRALLTPDSFVVAGPCVSTVPLPVVRSRRPSQGARALRSRPWHSLPRRRPEFAVWPGCNSSSALRAPASMLLS
jgi:membrane-bound inhibitor of C-type lysozyme